MARQVARKGLQGPSDNRIIRTPLFCPRSYQEPVWKYIRDGGKRAVTVWHRRSGKDLMWMNIMIWEMFHRPFFGTYLYVFPKLSQGRRDLWDAKTSQDTGGRPFRSFFPKDLVLESSETEMQITFKPIDTLNGQPHQSPQEVAIGGGRPPKKVGSIFQIMGTDKDSIDSIRGINVAGVVFSEYSEQDPRAWEQIISPVLAENGGWAAFNYTPKGRNHAFTLYKMALQNKTWFTSLLTIEQTVRDGYDPTTGAWVEKGGPVVPASVIEDERKMGRREEIIQQEYYCSWEGFLHGTIYGDCVQKARSDGRIAQVPWNPQFPVGACFDIGVSDSTAIWFYQKIGQDIRFIDYYEDRLKGAEFYAKYIRNTPYVMGRICLPWDATMRSFSSATTTEELFAKILCPRVDVAEKSSVQGGIDIARSMFPRFLFDALKCARGLECLESYKRKWDDGKNDYSGPPVHDEFSHGADALRTGVVCGLDERLDFSSDIGDEFTHQETDFKVFERVQ